MRVEFDYVWREGENDEKNKKSISIESIMKILVKLKIWATNKIFAISKFLSPKNSFYIFVLCIQLIVYESKVKIVGEKEYEVAQLNEHGSEWCEFENYDLVLRCNFYLVKKVKSNR